MKLQPGPGLTKSGLHTIEDVQGTLVAVVTMEDYQRAIIQRVNAHDGLVKYAQRQLTEWTATAQDKFVGEYQQRIAQNKADALAHFLTSIGEL